MKKDLTEFCVYNAMIFFLYGYEKRRYGYGTLQEILRELSLLPGGGTSNPAVWIEWQDCVGKSLKEILETEPSGEAAHRKYTELQAFNAMVNFFIDYYNRTSSGDLRTLMEIICSLSENSADQASWNDWNNSAKKALQKQDTEKPVDESAERNLTELQAFNTMVEFLEEYYEQTSSDLICLLLGDMLFWPDGGTIDPAVWVEWDDAVKKILQEQTHQKLIGETIGITLTEQQSFQAMVQFFKNYYELTSNLEAITFLGNLHLLPDNSSSNRIIKEKWKMYVNNALNEKPGIRGYRIECKGG